MFIHIIPQKDKLYLIIGYHKNHFTDWMKKYLESWNEVNNTDFKFKITNLFCSHIENWGISEEVYKEMSQENISKFIEKISNSVNDFFIDENLDFNIFN